MGRCMGHGRAWLPGRSEGAPRGLPPPGGHCAGPRLGLAAALLPPEPPHPPPLPHPCRWAARGALATWAWRST
jgi:hypothetical protein